MASLYGEPELLPPGAIPRQTYEQKRGFTDLQLIARLWLNYYILTEEFDRQHPGHWSTTDREAWMPCVGVRECSFFSRTLCERTEKIVSYVFRDVQRPQSEYMRRRVELLRYSVQIELAKDFDKRFPAWVMEQGIRQSITAPPPPSEYVGGGFDYEPRYRPRFDSDPHRYAAAYDRDDFFATRGRY